MAEGSEAKDRGPSRLAEMGQRVRDGFNSLKFAAMMLDLNRRRVDQKSIVRVASLITIGGLALSLATPLDRFGNRSAASLAFEAANFPPAASAQADQDEITGLTSFAQALQEAGRVTSGEQEVVPAVEEPQIVEAPPEVPIPIASEVVGEEDAMRQEQFRMREELREKLEEETRRAVREKVAEEEAFMKASQEAAKRPIKKPAIIREVLPTASFKVEVGAEQVVFSSQEQRFDPEEVPDVAPRAFIDADGLVHLFSGNFEKNFPFVGPTLENLIHVNQQTHHDPEGGRTGNHDWLAATYTEDGQTVFAIGHREFHAWEVGQSPAPPNPEYTNGWYNTLELYRSDDGGRTFKHIGRIASIDKSYSPENKAGPLGVFQPSNIIKREDGKFCFLASTRWPGFGGRVLICTPNLADPSAYQVVTTQGEESSLGMKASIESAITSNARPDCVVWNEYLGNYISIYAYADGRITYSLSPDLIHWGPVGLLADYRGKWAGGTLYAALLRPDPTLNDRNFEETGQKAWLYFMARPVHGDEYNRYLIRVPITFLK